MDEKEKVINRLKIAIVCVVIALFCVSGAFAFFYVDTTEKAEELTAQLTEITLERDQLESKSNTLTETISEQEKKINELEAQLSTATKPSSSSGSSSSSSPSQSATVYITRTGSKYHRAGCQYLRQSKIAINLSDAKNQGYTACSVCF